MNGVLGIVGTEYRKRPDGKYVELFEKEIPAFETGTLRMHKQPPCRFLECQQDWYLSDEKILWHQRKMTSTPDGTWKMPTSCPEHRDRSKMKHIVEQAETCYKTGKKIFRNLAEANTVALMVAQKTGIPARAPFECECGGFHMTSMSPEDQSVLDEKRAAGSPDTVISRAMLAAYENQKPPTPPPAAPATPPDELAEVKKKLQAKEDEACTLYTSGATVDEVSTTLNISRNAVYELLKKRGLTRKPGTRKPGTPISSPTASPIEVLESQIRELQRKKELLENAKKIRVEVTGQSSFVIVKDGERIVLPLAELPLLAQQLNGLMSAGRAQ